MNTKPRPRFARVLVAPTAGSKRRIIYGAFPHNFIAQRFADQLREDNPTWTIEVRRGSSDI